MTKQANDRGFFTEHSLEMRDIKGLDSKTGLVVTNLDFIHRNYKTGKWFMYEEKRRMGRLSQSQYHTFMMLDKSINHPKYKGFYVLLFQRTCFADGKGYLYQLHNAPVYPRKGESMPSLPAADRVLADVKEYEEFVHGLIY